MIVRDRRLHLDGALRWSIRIQSNTHALKLGPREGEGPGVRVEAFLGSRLRENPAIGARQFFKSGTRPPMQ